MIAMVTAPTISWTVVVTLMRMMDSATSSAMPMRKNGNHHLASRPSRLMASPATPAMVMGTKQASPKAYSQPATKPPSLPMLRDAYVYAYPAEAMRRVNPMITNARARTPMPPSRNASGVDPPATIATPGTLRSMAMPGASTDTEIATASQVLSAPRASVLVPSVTTPGPAAPRPVGSPWTSSTPSSFRRCSHGGLS